MTENDGTERVQDEKAKEEQTNAAVEGNESRGTVSDAQIGVYQQGQSATQQQIASQAASALTGAAGYPSTGRIVLYTLSENAVLSLIEQRDAAGTTDRYNRPHIGEDYPLLIVRVWDNEYGEGKPGVNGQVFLDGGDSLWVTSVPEGEGQGTWHWPVRN